MGLMDTLMHFGGKLFIEMPASRRTLDELRADLEKGQSVIVEQAQKAGDSEYHRKVLNHIIGIERWGQARLRVFLGDPFKPEEYDGYRPPRETSWADLQTQFTETRQATLALLGQIGQAQINPAMRSVHNMFGPLTPRGWLFYLYFHSTAESKRLRSAGK
jgi:hypothetical protein